MMTQAKALATRIMDEHKRASANIYREVNAKSSSNVWTTDLHALHVREALDKLAELIGKLDDPIFAGGVPKF